MLELSIVIPNYLLPDKNCELLSFTRRCVESLRLHCHDYELIVVDNGSSVGGGYLLTVADVYIRNRSNLGYAKAVNQGLKLAGAEWLVVSNNDVTFLDDWAATAIAAWESNTGALSSHLHDHDPEHKAGVEHVPWGRMFGALWMTRRDVLDKAGYLDEGYGLGMFEDKDFWRRLLAAGYGLLKAGWCQHIGNATWGKLPDQQDVYLRNKARFETCWGGA